MWNGRTEKLFCRSVGSAQGRIDTLQSVGSAQNVINAATASGVVTVRNLPGAGVHREGELMKSQLTIQALWEDDGLLTINSHAASWGFVGKTQVYSNYEALEKWAKDLAALPLVAGQSVGFQAGQRNSYAYLGVTISVLDSAGHCQCRVALESNATHTRESKNKLEVEILIEPNAIDRFVTGLMAIIQTKNRGEACLLGVDSLSAT